MSDIKKWVGEKNKSLGRVLEEGRRRRGEASIDHAGPVPRVVTISPEAGQVTRKIARGFWAAMPESTKGVLFGVTSDGGTELRTLNLNFNNAGSTYVVAPVKSDFSGTASPDGYNDVWSVGADGKTWVNGAPFPSSSRQYRIGRGRKLMFLRAKHVAGKDSVVYRTDGFITLAPYSAVTSRFVGIGRLEVRSGGGSVASAPDLSSFEGNFFSQADGLKLADLAPGHEWRLTHVATENEEQALRLELWMKGARSAYGDDDTGNNLSPVSTHQLLYTSINETITYSATGTAWVPGYMAGVKSIATVSTQAPDYPSDDALQLPILANIGRWAYSADENLVPVTEGFCAGYQPVNWYQQRRVHSQNVWDSQVVADTHVKDTAAPFNVSISTVSPEDYAAPVATQTFLYAPLDVSFTKAASGKQGTYSNKTLNIQWAVTNPPTAAGSLNFLHANYSFVAQPLSSTMCGGNSVADSSVNVSAHLIKLSAAAQHSPSAPTWLSGYSNTEVSKKRVFSGTASLTGYRASLRYTLDSAVGTILDVQVSNSYRNHSISGTKYIYPDLLNYASVVPAGPFGQAYDAPDGKYFPQSVYMTWYMTACPGSSANQTSELADFNSKKTEYLTEIAQRRMYHWNWVYGSWSPSTSAVSINANSGHKTRYELVLKEFLYLSPSATITLEVSLVVDYGVGKDYDSQVAGAVENTYLIEIVTSYLGSELDRKKIYDGMIPIALLDISNDYYGTEDYAGGLGAPVAHPLPTIRNGVGGIFPAYSQQECCPFIAYTTVDEVSAGAHPQIYLDMPVRLTNPRHVSEAPTVETEYQFPPIQLLNALNWMCANYTAEDDDSVKAFQYLQKLHESLGAAIKLRMYYTEPTGVVKGTLPPDLQAKYGLSTVHFGRI